jgi:Zn-finger nucleic acid-binding protein
MECPVDRTELEMISVHGVEVARCPSCNGLWFSEERLRLLKDAEDPYLRWIDIDPWEDPSAFRLSRSGKLCPVDGMPLYTVGYGDSEIIVDVCGDRHGIWLDEGEFREIIDWMHARLAQESFFGYLKDIGIEAAEIITGPEGVRSEALDFLIVAKLLAHRLLARFPFLAELIAQLPT